MSKTGYAKKTEWPLVVILDKVVMYSKIALNR